ncbi:hypothetical protein KFD70_11780 [Bacillus pfraonensis]|nr:hypothetical protein [Bacillus pseudomycoides]
MLLDKSLHKVLLNPKLLQQSTSEQHLIYLVEQYLKKLIKIIAYYV